MSVTLCVALLAVVMIGHTACADPCNSAQSSVLYNIAESLAGADSDQSQGQAPAQAQRHHCCAANTAGVLAAHETGALLQNTLKVGRPPIDAAAPQGEQGGQDRPPRVSVIA